MFYILKIRFHFDFPLFFSCTLNWLVMFTRATNYNWSQRKFCWSMRIPMVKETKRKVSLWFCDVFQCFEWDKLKLKRLFVWKLTLNESCKRKLRVSNSFESLSQSVVCRHVCMYDYWLPGWWCESQFSIEKIDWLSLTTIMGRPTGALIINDDQ